MKQNERQKRMQLYSRAVAEGKCLVDKIKCPRHAQRVRVRLNEYILNLPNHQRGIVTEILCHMKANFKLQSSPTKRHSHFVTDHALVMAMERVYGIDSAKLKDLVYAEVKNGNKYDFKGKEGAILTVLPKAMARL